MDGFSAPTFVAVALAHHHQLHQGRHQPPWPQPQPPPWSSQSPPPPPQPGPPQPPRPQSPPWPPQPPRPQSPPWPPQPPRPQSPPWPPPPWPPPPPPGLRGRSGPEITKGVPGAGGGAACATGVPPNSIAPVSMPAPATPTAALRADRSEVNICELLSPVLN